MVLVLVANSRTEQFVYTSEWTIVWQHACARLSTPLVFFKPAFMSYEVNGRAEKKKETVLTGKYTTHEKNTIW